MRGADITQESLLTVAKLDDFVPATHSLRAIRKLADTALQRMSALFDTLYADTGRASIAPEKLMRAQLLQLFYSLRSERMLLRTSGPAKPLRLRRETANRPLRDPRASLPSSIPARGRADPVPGQ